MNSDKKILICDKIEPEGVDLLKESGFSILENPTITPEELLEVISEVHVVVVRSRTKITESVINSGKTLELICRPGTGIDNIDSSTAEKNNIPVFTSVEASTNAVAELTISLAVSLARSIPLADRSLKDNQWIKNCILGSELRGKTFGIIGFGLNVIQEFVKSIGIQKPSIREIKTSMYLPWEELFFQPCHQDIDDQRANQDRGGELFHLQLSTLFHLEPGIPGRGRKCAAVSADGGNPAETLPAHSLLPQALQVLLLQGLHR